MLGNAESCIRAAVAGGGAGHFECPRGCSGWRQARTKSMLRNLKLLLADFDGCQLGTLDGTGLPALKPWRLATTIAKGITTEPC